MYAIKIARSLILLFGVLAIAALILGGNVMGGLF